MTAPANESDRIRSYLQSQAAEKSIEELIVRVKEGTDEMAAAARGVAESKLDAIPAGDEWSPMDCLRHAAGSNRHFATQILHVALTGELPAGEESDASGDRESIVAGHEEAIESLFVHVRDADPGAFLDVKWKHPMVGYLNWREWLIFLRIHSKDHARQLQAMSAT